jgi:Ca-activated chloride channel family protein
MTRSLPLIPDAELAPAACAPIAEDEPGFGALRTDRGHLPLEAMDVRARIDGLLARVVVRQTFVNAFEEPLEAAYIFPLPDRSAVTRFRMMVAGREIEGVLEERDQAREHYDRAIAEGRRASIAEEDRPGVLNLRVGNLMPGERATVELTLCGVLPYADGEVTFRFPLVVAPRYIPGKPLPGPSVGEGTALDTDAVPDASRISPPVLLPGFPNPVRLNIEVEMHDGAASAEQVRSSLQAVQQDLLDGYRRLRIQPGERLDRDFILRFRLGGDEIRSTLTLHPDADDREQGTFAMTIVPPAGSVDTSMRPRDFVFLLDRSGSMEGWKIVAARRALSRMIDTLCGADRFGVLAFDSTVEHPSTLPVGLSSAGDRNRFRAVEYLATIEARGGTEVAEPLDRAVKLLASSKAEDRDHILVLITDGQVGHEDQILSMLGTRLKGIRVFTIGIDRAVNEGFLRRLAERGGGSYELVESEDRLDEVMAAIHRRIGTPLLAGLNIDARELSIEPGEIVPRRLPDLFPGSPVLILGRYRGRPQGEIAIRGTDAAGTAYSESVPARVRENPAIATAWARGQIRQLEDRYAAGDGDRSPLEKAIVGISLRFQVLCRFTAYVAIDRSQVVNERGSVHRITQPVEMPNDWEHRPRYMQMLISPPCRSPARSDRELARARGFAHRLKDPLRAESARSAAMASSPPAPCSGDSSFMEVDEPACLDMVPPPPSGQTLAERPCSGGPMRPRDAAGLMAELALALQATHDRALIYPSISPHQILIDESGHPKLTGPPISLQLRADSPKVPLEGISCYTPPERLRADGNTFDTRGDIYALGVILYELLTGHRPFSDDQGVQALVRAIIDRTPRSPRRIRHSIPTQLEAICLKAMAKDPSARYATAREFADALRDFLKPRRSTFWK